MKIKIDLNQIELQLLSDVVSGVNITEEGLSKLGTRNQFLRFAIIEQVKERASKKLLKMQAGKYTFFLSELIVFSDYLSIMEIEDVHLNALRSSLEYRIKEKVYSKKVIE